MQSEKSLDIIKSFKQAFQTTNDTDDFIYLKELT